MLFTLLLLARTTTHAHAPEARAAHASEADAAHAAHGAAHEGVRSGSSSVSVSSSSVSVSSSYVPWPNSTIACERICSYTGLTTRSFQPNTSDEYVNDALSSMISCIARCSTLLHAAGQECALGISSWALDESEPKLLEAYFSSGSVLAGVKLLSDGLNRRNNKDDHTAWTGVQQNPPTSLRSFGLVSSMHIVDGLRFNCFV